jgi:hypothetical protein
MEVDFSAAISCLLWQKTVTGSALGLVISGPELGPARDEWN